MRSILLAMLFIFLCFGHVKSQDKKAFKTQFLEAEFFFFMGEFRESRFIYSELLNEDPGNANLQFLIGASYLSIPEEKSRSVPYLEKAVENLAAGYREGSYKERNAPPVSVFALAKAYHIRNELGKAKENYMMYRDIMKLQDPAEIDFVYKQIESCKLAEIMIKTPQPFERSPFGSAALNSGSNFNAVLAGEDSVMVYMSKKPFYTALMTTRLINGRWTDPITINDQLGVDDRCNVCFITHDGKELYISMEVEQVYDIYVSRFKKGKWSKIEALSPNINSEYSETHASVTADGKRLYFTSDRPGGEGAMDIWFSDKDGNGEWGPPVNPGKPLNSIYSEETPFPAENGKILYFSSMGHATMGGFDIFYSSQLPDGRWSYPANLGYPISTCDDDLFYFPLGKDRQALFSGTMAQGEQKQNIYLVNLDISPAPENVALQGTIKLEDNLQELDETFTVKITSAEKDSVIMVIPDQKTGKYSVELEPGNYELSTEGKGYTNTTENIAVVEGISRSEIRMETAMTPEVVSSGEYLIIRNVLFGFDKYSLDDEAKNEIEKLFRAMQKNPQIYVQVTGHADSKGDDDYNLRLSAKRARSVVDYLVTKGISKERFVSLGLGEQESIAMNQNPDGSDNPEGRRLNRYAEIKLINNSDQLIKVEPIEVPEHLRPKTDMAYSVLLAQTSDPAYVPGNLPDARISLTETDHARLFLTYEYRSRTKAVEILNYAIDNGFPDARILSKSAREELIYSLSDRKDLSRGPFTIQILALKNPVDLNLINTPGEVSQLAGEDGYYRYFTGFYHTREQALKDFQEQLSVKFPDAFITSLHNNSEASLDTVLTPGYLKTYYTIQFSAVRNPAERNKFKALQNVRVSFGEDGYYKYSVGLFDNRHEAEIELNRVKSLGYADTFLRRL